MSSACVDSSIILKLNLAEPDSPGAAALIAGWEAGDTEIVAPSLLAYEVTAVLHGAAFRGRITALDARQALEDFWQLRITLVQSPDLHERALELATELGLPVAYDAHYLAQAEALDCEFWTADRRLYDSIRERFPLIRLLA
jgi:predicted nucleic acid-binding protein